MEQNQEIKYATIKEILLDKYLLQDKFGNEYSASIKGNVKKRSNVLVGDYVEFTKICDKYVITKISKRKNELIRPPVSNIDNLVIVLSVNNPKPDYTLLDKELILCFCKNIEPIICINKIDLENEEQNVEEYVINTYSKLGIKVVFVSANQNKGIEDLKELLYGKISAFSGNSGVGKSSIIKCILGNEKIIIGEIGDKTKKGKHTTKHVKLYTISNGTYILDTPGFSSYELYDIEYKKIKEYYPEFNDFSCQFDDCNHINEDETFCAIKKNVNLGKIDKGRYERYIYIYNKLKEIDDKKYK